MIQLKTSRTGFIASAVVADIPEEVINSDKTNHVGFRGSAYVRGLKLVRETLSLTPARGRTEIMFGAFK